MLGDDGFECRYRCRCGERSFRVRYRRPGEDLIAWIESVVRPGMGEAHRRFSPFCASPHCDLMMPVSEGAKGIGLPVSH
jgi:hypothetical protein